MKLVATNFLRNLGSYPNGGIFQNTIRILLNDDLFSKSEIYTIMVRGGGVATQIQRPISTKSMLGDMVCMDWLYLQVGVSAVGPCAWPGFSLSQWKFPRHGATNESLQDWRLELSIVDTVQGTQSVLQHPRSKVDMSLTGEDTWRCLFTWLYV
jgi:hypothetical protein